MNIEAAEVHVVRLPLKSRFETSTGVETDKTFILVTLFSQGLEGYAETVTDHLYPLYREETTATALELLKHVLLPSVLGKTFATPEALINLLTPFRGHRMAKAALEMAFWDLWAKSLGLPLWQLLGGVREKIPVGVSLGIQESIEATLELAHQHLEQGYKRIKLKIKPGWDVKLVAATREKFPEANLTVDANSAYTLADKAIFQRLDEYHLDYIEQPLAYDDLHDHAKLQHLLRTPLCLDESILSSEDTRKALETNAARVINIKVGRVGGHLEARRIHDVAKAFTVPVWCGGMLESGIGRAHNLHLSSLGNFTKPGDTSASSRYFHTDIVNEAIEVQDGLAPIPKGTGIGVTLNRDFLETVTLEKVLLRP
jgi:o-succinylbenzoate synthase